MRVGSTTAKRLSFFVFRRADGAKEGDLLGKSPLNYTGNKACIALYLLDIMPTDIIGYIEAFCGSAELFLWKDPSPREILKGASLGLLQHH